MPLTSININLMIVPKQGPRPTTSYDIYMWYKVGETQEQAEMVLALKKVDFISKHMLRKPMVLK
jgi:hypothetical protein